MQDKPAPPGDSAPPPPAEEKKAHPPRKKERPPVFGAALILLFFAMALGIGYLLWLVFTTYKLVDPEAYLRAMRQGRVVERQSHEDALGWGSELLIDKKPDKKARIRFLLRNRLRRPVTDARVEIRLIDPNDFSVRSRRVRLAMKEPGVYRGEVDIKSGFWEAQIRVTEKGTAYQVTTRIFVPEK